MESVRIIKRIAPLNINMAYKALREEFLLPEERAIKILAALKGEKKAVVVVSKKNLEKEEIMNYYHCFRFLKQESECPVWEEDEELVDDSKTVETEEGMEELKLEAGGDEEIILERIYNMDDRLKIVRFEQEFSDEFGIDKAVVVTTE